VGVLREGAVGVGITHVMVRGSDCNFRSQVLSLFLAPWAEQQLETEKQALEVNDDISTVSPGVFLESRDGSTVFFVDNLDSSIEELDGVFIFNREA
jgi:lipopolysaccharide export LptBFGC system permease protein LptF